MTTTTAVRLDSGSRLTRARDALTRRAVGAERLLQFTGVGVLGRAFAGAGGEVHVQVRRDAALDQLRRQCLQVKELGHYPAAQPLS